MGVKTKGKRGQTKKQCSNEDVKGKGKVKQEVYYPLRTRMSPNTLFLAIQSFNDQQKELLTKCGFGNILRMGIDVIPASIGHFVVDKFDPKSMSIKTRMGTIKVTKKSIHDILGVPIGGTNMFSLDPKTASKVCMGWRSPFGGKDIGANDILRRIILQKDCGRIFIMNFILLFVNTMCISLKNGKCNPNVLPYVCDVDDLGRLDWCGYIYEVTKRCKDGWYRVDPNSYFCGPLTFLTLLYLDGTKCQSVPVCRKRPAIIGWNTDLIRARAFNERMEGGFGRCPIEGPFVEGNDGPSKSKGEDAKKYLLYLIEKKSEFEQLVNEGMSMFPDDLDIMKFGDSVGELWSRKSGDNPGEKCEVHGEAVENDEVSTEAQCNVGQVTPEAVRCDSIVLTQPGDRRVLSSPRVLFHIDRTISQALKSKHRSLMDDIPSFSIGLSQHFDEQTPQPVHQVVVREKRAQRLPEVLCSPYIRRQVAIGEPMHRSEQKIADMLISMFGDPK